jgi:CheY-like chemotaxis protein
VVRVLWLNKSTLNRYTVGRIFLIDDDPIYVFLVRKIIESVDSSLEISAFSDGELAINHLAKVGADPGQLPDIIFLDLSMPVLDGWGFLEEFHGLRDKFDKRIDLYIVSSSISPEDLERSRRDPMVVDFLIKPLERDTVADVILHMLKE